MIVWTDGHVYDSEGLVSKVVTSAPNICVSHLELPFAPGILF